MPSFTILEENSTPIVWEERIRPAVVNVNVSMMCGMWYVVMGDRLGAERIGYWYGVIERSGGGKIHSFLTKRWRTQDLIEGVLVNAM